ncbi:MAG: prolipoprotein diacylglyceryl transferase [Candidatus Peribacteraceae bacterium]|nr:prolipoprotein diacylglyceryl transferase [Candidatus Peribacteraceae bacterium]
MFEAFSIGPFLVWTNVIFLLLGIWLSTEFFLRLANSANLSVVHFKEHALKYLISFIIMGRVVSILANYRIYIKDPLRVFIVWDGGFSFLGGAIGIGLVLYLITRMQRTTFLQWLDVLLPAATFGLMFEWLGKFFAGRAYGMPTDMFWGVTYDTIGVRYVVPIHPVQLYYAFFFFVLTFLLLLVRKHSKRAGSETLFGILLAAGMTFFFEYFRGDFTIPVFATRLDMIVLLCMFISLGLFAAFDISLPTSLLAVSQFLLIFIFGGYLIARNWLPYPTFELRFSQFLSLLAALAVIDYVFVHRRKFPHL